MILTNNISQQRCHTVTVLFSEILLFANLRLLNSVGTHVQVVRAKCAMLFEVLSIILAYNTGGIAPYVEQKLLNLWFLLFHQELTTSLVSLL